jgi:tripartite-type tricarboxylate transporter receptor subunit TctC
LRAASWRGCRRAPTDPFPEPSLNPAFRAPRVPAHPISLRLALVLAIVMTTLAAAPAVAQRADYPSRPITVITPYPTGGAGDATMRLIASYLTKELGHNVLVDNRPGGATALGLGMGAKAAPDGYTIVYAPQSMVVNPHLYKGLPYDPFADFSPIAKTALLKYVLVTHPSVTATSVAELLAYAKAKPEALTFGSSGVGNGSHLAGELLMKMAGVKFLHVPYKGAGPALIDVMGGRLSMMFDVVSTADPHVRSGKVKALGVASEERSSVLPNVPTIAETVPGYSATFWIGLAAPKATPRERVLILSRAVNAVLRNAEFTQKLRESGIDPAAPNTPEEFAAFMRQEYALWGDLIKQNNIQAE